MMIPTDSIRVRFAPSPTGSLHLGGARTALFNYLFAKHKHGQFLLRIEDTDIQRSDESLTQVILRSLDWLGLHWDEEIVYQSGHMKIHQALCETLLESGHVYPCFCSSELLKAKRDAAQKTKSDTKYDRTCLNLAQSEIDSKINKGEPFALRFHVPEGETQFTDQIRGKIRVQHSEIEDFIIRRSDGTPTYQIAVVSDDHAMKISHIIRGDDHLSNTPKQILLYQALGWPVPQFGHVPMILGHDKKRLSKRHGATSVEAYRETGILPEALVNYLALLGWNPGDDREIMDVEELIKDFSIERISKKSAVFDEQKLEWMNGAYISKMPESDLIKQVHGIFLEKGWIKEEAEKPDYVTAVAGLLRDRVKRITDFSDIADYFFIDPDAYEEKAVKKHWKNETIDLMQIVYKELSALSTWEESSLETLIRSIAENMEIGAGKLIHPIRLAITGKGSSPGLFEVMVLLGREPVMKRIAAAIERLR